MSLFLAVTLAHAGPFTSDRSVVVRVAPDAAAAIRGWTATGEAFHGHETVTGPGCEQGWLQVEADGFVCLGDGVLPTDEVPRAQPPLLAFDPPTPEEFEVYIETGQYDPGQPELLVPAIYAKRWRRFKGELYADLEAYEAGDEPVARLERGAGMKYHFHALVESERGPVLLRDDGKVARLEDVYLYPVSRLQGFDLEDAPMHEGELPGFTVAYEGAAVRASPDRDAEVLDTLPYHSEVRLLDQQQGRWWPVAGGGWLEDERSVRRPVPSPGRPDGVGDDELWVDIELGQQVLMLRRGDDLVYFTVVSTGAAPMGSPKGTYRVVVKHALKDMRSRPGAADRYHVEDVPWAMYFRSTYAIHGAFWHWGYGRPASHGCINLAPADARALFERLGPDLPHGWRTIVPTERDPQVVVRVRRGHDVGRDRRSEISLPE